MSFLYYHEIFFVSLLDIIDVDWMGSVNCEGYMLGYKDKEEIEFLFESAFITKVSLLCLTM